MPQGGVTAAERRERERGCEDVDHAGRARPRSAVALEGPGPHGAAANREGTAVEGDHGAVRQFIGRCAMPPLRPAVEPFAMEMGIDFLEGHQARVVPDGPEGRSGTHSTGARGWLPALRGVYPWAGQRPDPGAPAGMTMENACLECACREAAAFAAGAVAGGERRHLVEEEQLGVAGAPDRAMASLEVEHAADPLLRGPAPPPQRSRVTIVKAPAAIAEQEPARGRRDELAEGRDPVLQRHRGRHCACVKTIAATSSGTRISQTRPSGLCSIATSPPSSEPMPRSISRVPNPRRRGFSTAGPPRSVQTRWSRSCCSASACSRFHMTAMLPSSFERAPYFAAFVASWWKASPSATAARGPRWTSCIPARLKRPESPPCA